MPTADPDLSVLTAPARPIIFVTQLPVGTPAELNGPRAEGMRRADYGDGARIIRIDPSQPPGTPPQVLTAEFHSAADPSVSRDGGLLLFAAKRTADEPWALYERNLATGATRAVTAIPGANLRSPLYLSTYFTITADEPWFQIGFIADATGHADEVGHAPATAIYTSKTDGSYRQQITYNLSSDFDPFIMDDGRLLYATWHRATLDDGPLGRIAIENINVDGIDRSPFIPRTGQPIHHMPAVTTTHRIVFVESPAPLPWDGAGTLGSVRGRRPLHTYEPLTTPAEGLFHSPSPLPEGRLLVSHRPAPDAAQPNAPSQHGLFQFDPETKALQPVLDDPAYHEIQAVAAWRRLPPDGRSSVVTDNDPLAKFYGVDIHITDLPEADLPRGTIRSIRVIEGGPADDADTNGAPASPLNPRRILAELPVHDDGSFQIEVPSNTPVQLQALDADGVALRSCGWIWARSHQTQGCIGCHEDPERTPPNRFVQAVIAEPVPAYPPADQRLTLDFQHDALPRLIAAGLIPADADPATRRRLYEQWIAAGDIRPGSARTSPLVWRLFGRSLARPYDAEVVAPPTSPIEPPPQPLSDADRQALVRWIDLGASWELPRPTVADPPAESEPPPSR